MRTLPVLLMGSCPGVGKTTVAEALVAGLRADSWRVDWFREEAVLEHPAFAAVATTFRKTGGVVPAELLASSGEFVAGWASCRADVLVVDALFPFVTSLLASGHSEAETEGFVRTLWGVLSPAQPLTIYVDGEPSVALQRAREGRGDAWMSHWTARVGRWKMDPPLRDIAAIARHFERERAFTLRTLERVAWPCARLDSGEETPRSLSERALSLVRSLKGPVRDR